MPGFNKTGPMGNGPMTGRKMGICYENRSDNTEYLSTRPGWAWRRGLGRGAGNRRRGLGAGRRFPFGRFQQENNEVFLKDEINFLKNQLTEKEKELEQLRNKKNND